MAKRKYRADDVKVARVDGLVERVVGDRVFVGIDVAKKDMYAAVVDEALRVVSIVKWKHPDECSAFIAYLAQLRDLGLDVEVVMEPSGVYGDALRYQVQQAGFTVFRVQPKRVHDAMEVFDGVPSLHDPKSAVIIAKLHRDGVTERWDPRSDHQRALNAHLRELEIHEEQLQKNCQRLDALLGRHWPELTNILNLKSATLLDLLVAYGGPSAVRQDEQGARRLMKRVGGHLLDDAKVDAVLRSAQSTIGVPQIEAELQVVMAIAAEARRNQIATRKPLKCLEALIGDEPSTEALADVVGKKSATVIVAALGDPHRFESPQAFQKACGLNLREKSSGKQKGALHITKRGPGLPRRMLYMKALRLIQKDPVVRSWYARKVQRMGGKHKLKAVVAIMRKLALALWHVAAGERFDAARLFDTTGLNVLAQGSNP